MQIIPVLDLLNDIVVHGVGGDRSDYKPIRSVICHSADPIDVVESLLGFYTFEIIYIADLNALQGTGSASVRIESLSQRFPKTEFWVDGGFNGVEDLRQYPALGNVTPIIASECLKDIVSYESLTKHLGTNQFILSLDHKNGELGAIDLFRSSELWPKNVIIMALDKVGKGNGPDLELIKYYQSLSPSTHFFGAGGVRDIRDVDSLKSINTAGALVASALHNGQISKEDFATL